MTALRGLKISRPHPDLLPQEKEQVAIAFGVSDDHPVEPTINISTNAATVFPSFGGAGRGGQSFNKLYQLYSYRFAAEKRILKTRHTTKPERFNSSHGWARIKHGLCQVFIGHLSLLTPHHLVVISSLKNVFSIRVSSVKICG